MPVDKRPVEFVEALEEQMRTLHAAGFSFVPFTLSKHPNYAVLPQVWCDKEKRNKASWDEYKTRQPEEEEYLDWLAHPATTGILLVCGYGGVFAFDFDPRPDNPDATVNRFMADLQDNGMWPEPGEYDVYAERSGGNGMHLVARLEEGVQVPPKHKLAFRPATKQEEGHWKATIEFQGTGAGIIVAPSRSEKGAYEPILGELDKLVVFSAELLDVWLGVAASLDERPAPVAVPVDHVDRKQLVDDESVIAAFRAVHPLREMLRANKYEEVTPYTWRRPGGRRPNVVILEGRTGIERAFHHNTNDEMHGKGINGGCDSFDYFVEFDHRGDFTAAIRAASQELGMSKKQAPSVPKAPPAPVQPTLDEAPEDDRSPWGADLFTSADTGKIKPPEYILGNIFMRDSLAFIVGPSSVGKTFWCIDQVCRLAPEGSVVLYVAGEGKSGLMSRINTWEDYYQRRAEHVYFLTRPVHLMDEDEVSTFIAYFSDLRPDVVVFDTLHVMMAGGDENSPKDMGKAIASMNRIRAAWGACVMTVHHVKKDGGYRGHSSLYNDADTFLMFEDDDGATQVIVTKQRNAKEPMPFWYELADVGQAKVALPIDPLNWAPPHMTALQRRILFALCMSYFGGSAKSNELLTQLDDASPGAVRKATSRLIDKDYCRREKDYITVTPAGRAALEAEISSVPAPADEPETPGMTYEQAQQAGVIYRPRKIGE